MDLKNHHFELTDEGVAILLMDRHDEAMNTLGEEFVRELEVVDWMEGIRKITLLPAQRLEQAVPAMAQKGRLQIGMDADIVVFDPGTITDHATFEEPHQYSTGVVHVLVNPDNGRPGRRPVRRVLVNVALGGLLVDSRNVLCVYHIRVCSACLLPSLLVADLVANKKFN